MSLCAYTNAICILGMGRFPDLLSASAKKVKDAMHRFKKCASEVGFCIAMHHFSNICIGKNTIYLYIITSGCATLLLFMK